MTQAERAASRVSHGRPIAGSVVKCEEAEVPPVPGERKRGAGRADPSVSPQCGHPSARRWCIENLTICAA